MPCPNLAILQHLELARELVELERAQLAFDVADHFKQTI